MAGTTRLSDLPPEAVRAAVTAINTDLGNLGQAHASASDVSEWRRLLIQLLGAQPQRNAGRGGGGNGPAAEPAGETPPKPSDVARAIELILADPGMKPLSDLHKERPDLFPEAAAVSGRTTPAGEERPDVATAAAVTSLVSSAPTDPAVRERQHGDTLARRASIASTAGHPTGRHL
ncbi:hypothetical protein J2S43_001949 [Catenuloplanes nepalensis]|uniref:Uncharacterized protein n=1 Tax=Catenuloplanes nepalensis TaxID=587533 RepID=A0ABT9MPW2_9ACTN|nr:hypothetical protein [Catenuloplanes nepalensis]MDP9793437.1 hypothetical protein [Catenuloplanes nepalensis]